MLSPTNNAVAAAVSCGTTHSPRGAGPHLSVRKRSRSLIQRLGAACGERGTGGAGQATSAHWRTPA